MTQLTPPPIVSRETLRSRFAATDWAFAESVPIPPHDLHPYPARFIPEVPAAALSLVSDTEGDVLDPFCGAGTTLVEALRVGRRATGIDLNPIATLITRVKVQRWDQRDDERLTRYSVGLRWASQLGDDDVLAVARDRIPRLDHWFTTSAQRLLAGATAFVETIEDPVWRDRVALAVSASVVRLSRQDSDTRYAAVDKRFDPDKATASLERSLVKIGDQLRAFTPHHSGCDSRVETGDAGDVIERLSPSSYAAAIFSPPYPNAYEYWLYHKYRMYWLGFDPLRVRTNEIGARPHYSGAGKATIETFAAQMLPIMRSISKALVPDGICLVVVGDSLIKGEVVDNASLFEDLAAQSGLTSIGHTVRPIRSGRKSFNLAVARLKQEHVLLFQKL